MEVIITEWAKQSYLDLRNAQAFTRDVYKKILRPDAELLKVYPNDPKFSVVKFWGPAVAVSNKVIPHGFKAERAFLCESYVKSGTSQDKRQMEKLKIKIRRIALGNYHYRGSL
jgi:hypothetical protein